MKLFNLFIFTRNQFHKILLKCRQDTIDISEIVDRDSTWSAIKPVLHDLEQLRANTWDQDKITHMQQWLKDNFEVKNDNNI